MFENNFEVVYAKTPAAWRKWLQKNHLLKQGVWLLMYNKASGKPSITWAQAVEEALCFGWIDSKKIKPDPESVQQFFSKRKVKSTWSKINKDKVEMLIAEGRMRPAGMASVEVAQQNGSWTVLDPVEALTVPPDLAARFRKAPKAAAFYEGLSKSVKKSILHWLLMARTETTRQKRLAEVVESAARQLKPGHLR